MAPLDFGTPGHLHVVAERATAPEAYDTLGGYLRAVRERRGERLDALSEATRIRRSYLEAIEDGDRSVLPSRPFAIGYVRAYARELALDPDVAVARFKAEWPEERQGLRNPVGVAHEESDPRKPLIYAGVGVLVAAVALWNVAQRTLIDDDPAPPNLPAAAAPPASPAGPAVLAATTPAPAESSLPAPYVTPGMDPVADADAAALAAKAAAAPKTPTVASPGALVFATKRPVAGAVGGPVLLQARGRSVLVVARRPDNTVAFARVLQPGEAFRAPADPAMAVEAGDPSSIDVYVNGRLQGELAAPVTALARLAPAAPAPVAAASVPVAAPHAAPPPAAAPEPRAATPPATAATAPPATDAPPAD